MGKPGLPLDVEEELAQARRSRRQGKEGRARVCARRAAGAVVQDYLRKRGVDWGGRNVYQALLALKEIPGLDQGARRSLHWLTLRVNPDHQIPGEVDLIAEAENLIRILTGSNA